MKTLTNLKIENAVITVYKVMKEVNGKYYPLWQGNKEFLIGENIDIPNNNLILIDSIKKISYPQGYHLMMNRVDAFDYASVNTNFVVTKCMVDKKDILARGIIGYKPGTGNIIESNCIVVNQFKFIKVMPLCMK